MLSGRRKGVKGGGGGKIKELVKRLEFSLFGEKKEGKGDGSHIITSRLEKNLEGKGGGGRRIVLFTTDGECWSG